MPWWWTSSWSSASYYPFTAITLRTRLHSTGGTCFSLSSLVPDDSSSARQRLTANSELSSHYNTVVQGWTVGFLQHRRQSVQPRCRVWAALLSSPVSLHLPLLSHPPSSPPPQHFILPARLGNTSLSGSELIAVGWRVLSREAMGASERERQREADFRLPLQFQERMQPIMIQDVPGKGQLKLQQA